MLFARTFSRLRYRLISLAFLAVQLLFIISSTNISPSSAQCANKCLANTTCVRRAQSCLALTCDLYPEFYKSPNVRIGTSEKENPFPETHNIAVINRTRTLTIKTLNLTDTGRGVYYSVDEDKDEPFKCFFNLFIYGQSGILRLKDKECELIGFFAFKDLENYGGGITVENVTSSVKLNKTFEVAVKSFDEKVNFKFSYEALPLNRLKFNDQVLTDRQVTPCSPTTPWLSCLESTNLEVKLEKCQNKYPLKIDYEYDYKDEFEGVLKNPLSRPMQYAIELSCKRPL